MRELEHFDFAQRSWSFDRFVASLDDRVISALVPLVIMLAGLGVQTYFKMDADARAAQLMAQLQAEQPQIATVETMAAKYQQLSSDYAVLTQKVSSGPRTARSLAAWMSGIPRDVVLSNVNVSDGGNGLIVSGAGPSVMEIRHGVIDVLASVGGVSSATLSTQGRSVTYTVTSGATSPPSAVPSTEPAAAAGASAVNSPSTPMNQGVR